MNARKCLVMLTMLLLLTLLIAACGGGAAATPAPPQALASVITAMPAANDVEKSGFSMLIAPLLLK